MVSARLPKIVREGKITNTEYSRRHHWVIKQLGKPMICSNSYLTRRGMGKYQVKRDKADNVFSQYIRLRDRECRRCHSPVEWNAKGLPVTHQASHFQGRGKEATRFDEENVDTLCGGCHMYFTSHPAEHYQWQVHVKGQKAVDMIVLRSNTYQKKDRQLAYLYWNQRLKELMER